MNLLRILLRRLTVLRMKLILITALDHIGVDASPQDRADDVLGCAESVTEVLRKAGIKISIILGTWTLDDFFENSPKWVKVETPEPGDVLVSPTGTGNGVIRGHTGIVGNNMTIMSNDSYSGKWMAHYTLKTWRQRYVNTGGMPMNYYRLK